APAERREQRAGIPGKAGAVDVDQVGEREAFRKCIFQDALLERIRARLEDRKDAPVPMLLAQSGDGFADRRGVMREIVIQRNAAHLALALQAPAHAAEPGERLDRSLRLYPGMAGGGDGGDAV